MAFLLFSLVMFILSGVSSGQEFFTITREFTSTPNSDFDLFRVPPSNCTDSGRECKSYHSQAFATHKDCQCKCPYGSSTFGFFYKSWTCIENAVIRRQSGCSLKFDSEQDSFPLTVLKAHHNPLPYVTIQSAKCSIDFSRSQYLECDGTWSRLRLKAGSTPITLMVTRSGRSQNYKYILLIKDKSTLRGKVIRLYFKCPSSLSSCLLFKMAGETKCAIGSSTVITTKPSTIQPSTSSNNTIPIVPTKGHQPGERSETGSTSSGAIAAVVTIVIIIIVIAVLIGYIFWKRKRGERVWLLDQFSNIARKVRRPPPSRDTERTKEEQIELDQDYPIYAEIPEYQTGISIVEGRTNKPSNGKHQLTIDVALAGAGESRDDPVGQRRGSLTDEEGYMVPVRKESAEYATLREDIDRNGKPIEGKRIDQKNSYNETAIGCTSSRGRKSITDEYGYACPTHDSPEHTVLEASGKHGSSTSKGDRNVRGNTYDQVGQVVPTRQDHESRTERTPNENTKRTRRRPPSPPRKI